MAEMQLTDEQLRQIESLTMAVGQDAALRERLQSDPHLVFAEYGLGGLLPGDVQFEVDVGQAEVVGFTGTGHWDIGHADVPSTGGTLPFPHVDFAHADVVDAARTGGFQIGIRPVLGPSLLR
jgi:hypothetical protein